MCSFEYKQVRILENTETFAHKKKTSEGFWLSSHLPPSKDRCGIPCFLQNTSVDQLYEKSMGGWGADKTHSQTVRKLPKFSNHVSRLRHGTTLLHILPFRSDHHKEPLWKQNWVTIAMTEDWQLGFTQLHMLWLRIISDRLSRRLLNFNTHQLYMYSLFQLLVAWTSKVFLFLFLPRNYFKIKGQSDAYS